MGVFIFTPTKQIQIMRLRITAAAILLLSLSSCVNFQLTNANLAGNWDVMEFTDKTTTPATVSTFSPGQWTWVFDSNGGFVIGSLNCTYTIQNQQSLTLVINATSYPFTVNKFTEAEMELESNDEKYKFQR